MIVSDEYQEWLRKHLIDTKLTSLAFLENQEDSCAKMILKFQRPDGYTMELEVWRPASMLYRGYGDEPVG